MIKNIVRNMAKAKEAWLKALKKYSDFINSDTFQLAHEGTKQYEYADKRTGILEDQVLFKFEDYKNVMDYFLDGAVREAALFKVATDHMNAGKSRRDDLWYRYTAKDMTEAQNHPQRFIKNIDVEEAI